MSSTESGQLNPRDLAEMVVMTARYPDQLAPFLSEDITWWITPSIPSTVMASLTVGREEVLANLRRVFGELYDPSTMTLVVHNAIGEGSLGAVRFAMSGQFPNGGQYSNEYSLWVEASGGLVRKVWEYVDMAHTTAQIEASALQ